MPRQLDFVADAEPWCRYTLEDGTVIKVRVMLTRVYRDGLDTDGKPKYQLGMQQVCDCDPSELAIQSAKEEAEHNK